MHSTAPHSHAPRRGRRLWKILGAAALLWVVAVTMMAVEIFTLTPGANALRNEMLAALKFPARAQIQLGAGPGTLAAARTALRFIHEAPAEAREALVAVRSGSVGVYRLDTAGATVTSEKLFAAADHALGRRGWTRAVAVNNADATVVIYVPSSDSNTTTQHVCLAVCEGEQLVIVEGTLDGDQLAKFAMRMRPQFALN